VGLRENGIIDSIIFNPARTPETSGVQQNLLNVATLNSSQPEKAVFREGVAIAQAGEQTARRQYVLETGYEKTNNLELAGKSPLLINQNRNDSQADLLEQNPGKATGIAELTNIPRKIASNISEMTMKPPEGAAKPSDIIVPAALAHAGLEETEVLVKKALNVLGSEKNSLTNETAKPSDSSNRPAGMLPGIPENASKPEEPTRNTPAALTKPIAMFVPATAAHSHLEEYEASGKGTSTILQNATMMKNAADPNAAQIHAHPVVQKPETGAIINDAPLKYQVIAPQLMDGVARIYNTHPNRVKITLNPPELGQLDISVLVKSNKVTLSIVVDSDEVRQVLIANNNFLKNSLQTQGMTVDNMNISLKDGSFRQDLGQGQGGFPERQTGEDPSLPKNRGADATHTPVDPDGSEEGEYRPARISIFI
ncbi:MAG: flagellar hook-length control protein FliK, partial [Smithellaceae bacterium]|nr:flagellar hook-length control protein FliK [Smithellaceae bacterium]